MPLDRQTVLANPFGTIARVHELIPNAVGSIIADATPFSLIVDLRLAPPLELAAHGYPVEPVRIVVHPSSHMPLAYPLRGGLEWLHRYPDPTTRNGKGSLCLWYPKDPEHLRWTWHDGFETFVQIVHRHLIGEDTWRRTGEWPWPDTPHGERSDGRPHPVRGRLMCA